MSIKAMVTVWESSKQKGNGLLLMLAIADYMNDFGEAWPSIDSLGKKTRCSRTTVIDMTKRCESDDELEIAEGEGRNGTNRYRLGAHYRTAGFGIPTATSTGRSPNQGVRIAPLGLDPILQEPSSSKSPLEDKVPNESGPISNDQTPWVQALAILRNETGRAVFDTWLRDTELVSLTSSECVIGCKNEYGAAWLREHVGLNVRSALYDVLGREVSVRFVVADKVAA